jgi:TPR repeat protein
MMYQLGQGVRQGFYKALVWYFRAAEQNNARAQLQIGKMFDMRLGVSRDYVEAARWFQKAAENGSAGAQK